jgi:hypothetical protein
MKLCSIQLKSSLMNKPGHKRAGSMATPSSFPADFNILLSTRAVP